MYGIMYAEFSLSKYLNAQLIMLGSWGLIFAMGDAMLLIRKFGSAFGTATEMNAKGTYTLNQQSIYT